MKTVRTLYLVLANTLILLLAILLATHFFIKVYHRYRSIPPRTFEILPDIVKPNYRHMAGADVDALLFALDTLHMRYEPWVGYKEEETTSRFVNVDEYGIRANGPSRRTVSDLDGAVWFFGGSTTFGYGVADAETIPARLENLLGRPVVNLGAGGYYSAQENVLLNQYLRIGYRPSLAIFLDGINERCDMEDYQAELKRLFAKAQHRYEWDVFEIVKPVIFAYGGIRRRINVLLGETPVGVAQSEFICEDAGRRAELRAIHERNLAERSSLCRLYQIECRTFVQPFAGVHGQHDDMVLRVADRQLMREKFNRLEENWRRAGAVFVTGALDGHKRHAFVDGEHYSAAAIELIARAIAESLAAPGK